MKSIFPLRYICISALPYISKLTQKLKTNNTMSLLKRLFKIGQAEAHSAVDNLEDPIKLTEQSLRDLRADLEKSLHGLAEIKALVIRTQNEITDANNRANEYETKAMQLLQKAAKGLIDSSEADRLATEALVKKDASEKFALNSKSIKEKYEASESQMQENINTLKSQISKWEDELKELKARVKVSTAAANLNKQMAQLDSSGTIATLNRMKEKVAQQEALAESYGQIASESKSIDDEINKALGDIEKIEAKDKLAALKAKLSLETSTESAESLN